MALTDYTAIFSDHQAITGSAASSSIPVGPGDFGQYNQMYLNVFVTADFNNLTSLNVALRTDSTDAFGSPTILVQTGEILLASLVDGYKFPLKGIPAGCEEYIDLYYTVTGTDPTTGTIFAYLGLDPDNEFNSSF